VITPDKLRHLGPMADLGRLSGAAGAAEQSEGQQVRQRERDPRRDGTGAGEPLTGGRPPIRAAP
jgi:hypothetical protein